ncbi:hypothetical protein [Microbulbifer sp. TRSA001]|uniref:hypothetical protein n=1 Tax=unclassified Microbulbifer TaxID=2619833 RepID=UPI00403AB2C4
MKIIVREYLASLRERGELDSLLPDLLSEMGLVVFSRPGIGVRQYGVDVGAYGSLFGGEEKVYLFSVKAGNIDRKTWSGDSPQDLKPSLDEIIDVYVQTHLPAEYQGKPVEICICFGGEVREDVRLNLSAYQAKNTKDNISFSEWGGEKLAGYIEDNLLKEELLPDDCRRLLRKSLSMIDEPDSAYKYFKSLVTALSETKELSPKKTVTAARQIYLCFWILYAWCREEDNLESAYRSGELCLLHLWDVGKPFLGKKNKESSAIQLTILYMQTYYLNVCEAYFEDKILPHTKKKYALSAAVSPTCFLDVNLKMFDLIGRMAMFGIWGYFLRDRLPGEEEDQGQRKELEALTGKMDVSIKELIKNNPVLLTPIKDDQAIDVFIAIWFLALNGRNAGFIHEWLDEMINGISWQFVTNKNYPCILNDYYQLLEHPVRDKEGYKEEVTAGSIFYPYIASFAAIFGFERVYQSIQELIKNHLEHCNLQVWFPDEETEVQLYKNINVHGATMSHVAISSGPEKYLEELFSECDAATHFASLSVIRAQWWPIIFLASRHYRIPVPIQLLKTFLPSDKSPEANS